MYSHQLTCYCYKNSHRASESYLVLGEAKLVLFSMRLPRDVMKNFVITQHVFAYSDINAIYLVEENISVYDEEDGSSVFKVCGHC